MKFIQGYLEIKIDLIKNINKNFYFKEIKIYRNYKKKFLFISQVIFI
jgi:hypothetical protein